MAIDRKNFARTHDFKLATQRLGEIQCGSLKAGMHPKVAELLKASDINNLAFSRQVLGLVAIRRLETEGENASQSEAAKLSDEELSLINDEEVDSFAMEFVAHNEWLLPNDNEKRQVVSDENGERVVRFVPLIDDFKKTDDETGSDYFVRVLRHYLGDQQLRMKKMLEPLSAQLASGQFTDSIKKMLEPVSSRLATNIYKDSTLESLRMNFSLSDQLKDTIKSFSTPTYDSNIGRSPVDPAPHQITEVSFPENPLFETNKRLNSVLEHIEDIRPLLTQSADLIRNMNDTAIRMQTDFMSNARSSAKYTQIAIGIAAISLVVSSVFSWLSYSGSKQDSANNDKQTEAFRNEIRNIIAAQEKDRTILLNALNVALKSQKE